MTRKLAGGKLILDHPADALARLTISNPEKRNALDHHAFSHLSVANASMRPMQLSCRAGPDPKTLLPCGAKL